MKKLTFALLGLLLVVFCDACKKTPSVVQTVIEFEETGIATLPFDLYSTLKLRVKIDANADPDKRAITFTTDLGKFSNETTTIVVTADKDGYAEAVLKADKLGLASVKATVATSYSATRQVNFIEANADSMFGLPQVLTNNVPADGVSTAIIEASLNVKLPADKREVIFTSDVGTFANNTATITHKADLGGKVMTYLKHDKEGMARLTLSSNGITRNLNVNFVKAAPDQLTMESPIAMGSGLDGATTLNLELSRIVGKPSTGFSFDYLAKDSSGKDVGVFNNGKSSGVDGKATVKYAVLDTAFKGKVMITISVKGYPNIASTASIIIN